MDETETSTQHRTDNKAGRLLETILDESTGTASPSPAQATSPRADLSWSDVNFTPKSLKTSLFHESPPERDPLSARLDTFLSHTDVKHTSDMAADEGSREPLSFNHSLIQPTPNSVKKSLFEGSPQQMQPVTPSHPGTQETPESARVPLDMGPSPQLDFWLLPQNGNLNYSGVQTTPNSMKTELLEGTPLENGNSPFGGLGFLSRSHEILSPSTTQPTPLKSPFARHTTPEIRAVNSDHKLDTTELAERLNRIKQPSLPSDTWGLQHNTSSNHVNMSVNTALIGETPSRHANASREVVFDSSGTQPTSSQPSHVRQLTPQYAVLSEQRETVVQSPSGVHPTPKPATFFKETSFQNVSSSSYEVDTSALIQRLNKIKLTQQSFSTPHYAPSRPIETRLTDSIPRKENVVETGSDTSLLASRLDQIKQAQKSQQVLLTAVVLY